MTVALCLLVAQLCVFAAEPPATFGPTNIWTIELRVTPRVCATADCFQLVNKAVELAWVMQLN